MAISAELCTYLDFYPDYFVVATDGSAVNETSGAGIYFPLLDAQYPVRPPDYTPVYDTEHIAILLALRRLPASISKVFILFDSLSVICSLS